MSDPLDRRLAELTPADSPWTDAIRLVAAEAEVKRQAERLDSVRRERQAIRDRLSWLPDETYCVRSGGRDYRIVVAGDDVHLDEFPDLLEARYTTVDAPTPDDVRRHGFAAILPADACCGECDRVKGGAA
jgi:hypothetical protein